ncbi:MAG TPA: endonuclease/exonuclease/phosphatase family protein [Candidatus Limnocylindria bacterium]|jgi:hypothetical protein|nr:endonuclease/exonuclease/phosphatase family protein [Candidatus Limnocylindria bacterium]
MTRRRSGAFLALCAAVAALSLGARASAGTFSVFSQNTLHMGWGKAPYQTDKNGYFKNTLMGTTYDVILMQEVMPKLGGLNTVWPNPPTGSYYVFESAAAGKSTYRETYGTLVKASLGNVVLPVGGASYTCYSGAGFSRPPCGVLVKIGQVGTWFLDYHAMFGNVHNRAAEVGNMSTVVATFASMSVSGTQYSRVVVGGDWNFSKAELAKILTLAGTTLDPDTETSLTPTGALSSRYDHFWCSSGVSCTNASAITAPPSPFNTLPKFRAGVSDHVGVTITVTY